MQHGDYKYANYQGKLYRCQYPSSVRNGGWAVIVETRPLFEADCHVGGILEMIAVPYMETEHGMKEPADMESIIKRIRNHGLHFRLAWLERYTDLFKDNKLAGKIRENKACIFHINVSSIVGSIFENRPIVQEEI